MLLPLVCIMMVALGPCQVGASAPPVPGLRIDSGAGGRVQEETRPPGYPLGMKSLGDSPLPGLMACPGGPAKRAACGKGPLPEGVADHGEGTPEEERHPPLMVLVSFSLPRDSLKALGRDLQQVGGRLVFRGLLKGSFQETAKAFRALGVPALLDPLVFRRFQATGVPLFVLRSGKTWHRVAGHVSLRGALTHWQSAGIPEAKAFLWRLQGSQRDQGALTP